MTKSDRTRTPESQRAASTVRAAVSVGVAAVGLLWLVAGLPATAGASNGGSGHKVVICHVPPDDPEHPQELRVDVEDWEGHAVHPDDYEGPCQSGATTTTTTAAPSTTGSTVATPESPTTTAAGSPVPLHNASAGSEGGCPSDGGAYWHFVLTPNNGSSAFTSITLNLNGTATTFSGAQIVPNGGQTDNVFVAVPPGHALTDLQTAGSSATYSGATPTKFVLSHVCPGTVATTTTAPTTSTTEPTTTTTEATTSTTTTTTTTTTTAPTTTVVPTTVFVTTTTTGPTTTAPTTTEPPVTVLGSTTIVQPTTTTTEGPPPSVLGATTVVEPTTTTVRTEPESKVLGITAVRGAGTDLAQTGTRSGALAAGALALVLGGLLLLGVRGRRLDG